jgi:hypothetical protein
MLFIYELVSDIVISHAVTNVCMALTRGGFNKDFLV